MIGGEREGMFGKSQMRRPFPGGGAAARRLLCKGAAHAMAAPRRLDEEEGHQEGDGVWEDV